MFASIVSNCSIVGQGFVRYLLSCSVVVVTFLIFYFWLSAISLSLVQLCSLKYSFCFSGVFQAAVDFFLA